jgi:Raf kinase inhibitor-like YbhB/YbcL family protein
MWSILMSVAIGASALQITSPHFSAGGPIPRVHTCQGSDTSPALAFSGVPPTAKSLVLIVDDPDAPDPANPKRTWVHWVVYNLPPSTTMLPDAVRPDSLPSGARNGKNDWNKVGWGGPCPPIGTHRYFHKLYALDVVLPDLHEPTKDQLLKAMEGHVVASAELIGTYRKD